uniref:NADH:ubiquinone reductase (H(+)-translocating) n=1 Tax=Taenia tianguangfui TaxID=1548223 RepID=A0A8K1QY13_9CEST|nr:NADH dehydrogenase subunit 5 [Taenia tianguangfui]
MISLLTVSLVLCSFILILYILGLNMCISFNFLSFGGFNWLLNFDFDNVTFVILLMLSICFFYVLNYTNHYFTGDYLGYELNKIIILFVSVMGILVSTGDFISTLIFWEYLGVVSFFLILFYSNYLSVRSSIITLVSSRFGDVCLFLLIGLNCFVYNNLLPCMLYFFFLIFTKSASFPFISWLLEAMRAPTPVSSLVHSSTLVAAGVWFAMRYDYFIYFSDVKSFILLLIITILITGMCNLFFLDLKKIIALSTCNNISWCVLYLIYGDLLISLFQLLSHGVSKCMLFMLVGDIMNGSSGSQSCNCVYSTSLYGNWNLFSSIWIVLGLSGVPFIGIFFTKHFFLSNLCNVNNLVICFSIFLCMFLSYLYSFRLSYIIYNVKSSLVSGVIFFFNSGLMVFLWLFINFFIFWLLDENVYVNVSYSLNLILFQIVSCLIVVNIYDSTAISNWSSSLFGCDNLVKLFYGNFLHILHNINIFILRWDNIIINLFNNIGFINSNSLYNNLILNILMLSSFGFLFYLIFL